METERLIYCHTHTLVHCVAFGVSIEFGCCETIIEMKYLVNEIAALLGANIDFNSNETNEFVQSVKG